MKVYERILNEIFCSYHITELSEDIDQFKLIAKCNQKTSIKKHNFERILNDISDRDRIRINIMQEGEPVIKFSTDDDLIQFISELEYLSNDSMEEYDFNLVILKSIKSNDISVYNIDKLVDYLDGLSFRGILNKLSDLIHNDYLIFRPIDDIIEASSKTIYFSTNDVKNIKVDIKKRNEEINKRRDLSNWISSNKINLIPSDFDLYNSNNYKLSNLFNKIKCVLAIMGISDIVNIKDGNKIDLILNGYKRIECTINFNLIEEDIINQYYDVYSWIYIDGNPVDKIGIARNIISLSILDKNILKLNSSLMPSIESAHTIYLKENVKEYLDTKSKDMEFLFELSNKTSELSNNIGKALLTNVIAFITIFLSTFIYNVAKEKDFNEIFSKEVTYLSIALLIGSVGYLIFSIIEVKLDLKRYKDIYNRIRNSYDDVLAKSDIKKIFKNDLYLKEDELYVRKRSKIYIVIWILLILFIGIFIWELGNEHITPILKNIYNRIFF